MNELIYEFYPHSYTDDELYDYNDVKVFNSYEMMKRELEYEEKTGLVQGFDTEEYELYNESQYGDKPEPKEEYDFFGNGEFL